MIGLDDRPRRNAAVSSTRVDDEAVLVLLSRGEIKVLNEVGARVWDLLDGSLSVRQIVDALCAEFDVQPAQAEPDTVLFLSEMMTKGMLEAGPAPAADAS